MLYTHISEYKLITYLLMAKPIEEIYFHNKKWIAEGEPVAHRTNLNLQMSVIGFEHKTKEIISRKGDPYAKLDKTSGHYVRKSRFLLGILCQWFIGKELKKDIFHSKELIPWAIAKQGQNVVDQWIDSLNSF